MNVPRALIAVLAVVASAAAGPATPEATPREAMRDFVVAIALQARAADPDFLIVPQNGLELLTQDGRPDGALVTGYVQTIDGVGQEDLSFGYTADETPTPKADHERLLALLDRVRASGRAALIVDYCRSPAHIAMARDVCAAHGFAGYAAPGRNLERIASDDLQPFAESATGIETLSAARNVLFLLNPERFVDRATFVASIDATDYDALILDAAFDVGQPLSRSDVASLQTKPGGGRRIVLAYLSMGEAEDYRDDWDPGWRSNPPSWLGEENSDWPGDYAVEYWNPEWQEIVATRVRALVDAGFDGAYLDKVDAYETFEESP